MKAYPEGVDERILVRALSSGWDLQVAVVEYFPVGFGSYHWLVDDVDGKRRFITVDDLAHKPWLGRTAMLPSKV